MTVERALVVGTGVMARDIAVLLSRHGIAVELQGRSTERADAATAGARKTAGRRGGDPNLIASAVDGDGAAARVDLIIEAIVEATGAKRDLLARVSAAARPTTLLATTTSGIPIAELADAVVHPERFLGLHFYNPATSIRGVEVVPGSATSDDTIAVATALLDRLDKHAIAVSDGPGFVGTRLILRYVNEAAAIVAGGTPPDVVDAVAVDCLAMPLGPCALMDLIGLDVVATSLDGLAVAYGADFIPNAAIVERVSRGALGRKAGVGFHNYT